MVPGTEQENSEDQDHLKKVQEIERPWKVSVVVVAHNEEAKIAACVGSLAQQEVSGLEYEILLVDDGSTDRTVEIAREAAPDLRVISNPSKSISSNRNRGFREATHPWVAFIDADCEAPAHWLQTLTTGMAERLESDPDVAAVGSSNIPPAQTSTFYDTLGLMLDTHIGSRGSVQGRVFEQGHAVGHLPGLNVLFRKDALEKVGGWDERFRLIGEDEDLSHRLTYQGYRLFYVPGAAVIHRQRSDFRSWSKNMFAYGKGRTWLLRRHPNIFELGFLVPPFLPVLLWAYLPVIALVSVGPVLKSRRPGLWLYLTALYAATHISYGMGLWAGMFSPGDSERSRKKTRRLGCAVTRNLNHSHKDRSDDGIIDAVQCLQRALADSLTTSGTLADTDIYLLLGDRESLDLRPIPEDADAARRMIEASMAEAMPESPTARPGWILRLSRLWALRKLDCVIRLDSPDACMSRSSLPEWIPFRIPSISGFDLLKEPADEISTAIRRLMDPESS